MFLYSSGRILHDKQSGAATTCSQALVGALCNQAPVYAVSILSYGQYFLRNGFYISKTSLLKYDYRTLSMFNKYLLQAVFLASTRLGGSARIFQFQLASRIDCLDCMLCRTCVMFTEYELAERNMRFVTGSTRENLFSLVCRVTVCRASLLI